MDTRLYRFEDLKKRRICDNRMAPLRLPGFPKAIKLGARSVAWLADEVDAWLAARVAASRAADTPAPASKPPARSGRQRQQQAAPDAA